VPAVSLPAARTKMQAGELHYAPPRRGTSAGSVVYQDVFTFLGVVHKRFFGVSRIRRIALNEIHGT